MTDWQTVSALATAGGTLVLAAATFSAVRSSNRSARIAEEALYAGMRPLLVPSLVDDPRQKVLWGDQHGVYLPGGRATAEHVNDVVYLAIGVRNLGNGIALMHGWSPTPERLLATVPPAPVEQFRRLTIDLYVAPGAAGYWEGALREPDDPLHVAFAKALTDRQPFTIDVLYGDQLGGQRTISRFIVMPAADDLWLPIAARHWHLDRPDPR